MGIKKKKKKENMFRKFLFIATAMVASEAIADATYGEDEFEDVQDGIEYWKDYYNYTKKQVCEKFTAFIEGDFYFTEEYRLVNPMIIEFAKQKMMSEYNSR